LTSLEHPRRFDNVFSLHVILLTSTPRDLAMNGEEEVPMEKPNIRLIMIWAWRVQYKVILQAGFG
jgi:hypothetical protein